MNNKRTGSRLDGFLILLLFLFIIFYTAMDKNRGIDSIEKKCTEYHPAKDEMSAFHKVTLGIPININRESVYGLTAIPGIGNSLARTVTEGRIKRNGFTDINELKTLPGIGEKLFSKIAPYISI
ncbi:MAG: helix-hairpin-helix domain-containing protein [Desulfobacteraceae bacterium]|jgi:DNA uptake protein ComE-like DNA-binding protein